MKCVIEDVLSNGYILGTIKHITNISFYSKDNNEDEIDKLKKAINDSIIQVQALAKENKQLEEYLKIQELMIADPELERKTCAYIQANNVDAATALKAIINTYTVHLLDSSSTYLQERIADIEDACQRIVSNMGSSIKNRETHPYILVVDTLYPTYLISHKDNILGIIAKHGGYTSHTAILCRSWDIPYVISQENFKDNEIAIIDTRKKLIIQNPTSLEISEYARDLTQRLSFEKRAIEHKDFLFLANVGSNLDLKRVLEYNFDGIGLYRTEMIFMNTNRPYTFLEQYNIYLECVKTMKNKMVCFRTFDIGDDKQLSYVKVYKKGIDTYKNNPLLFIDQVKALLKANIYGNIRIMFPMIETKEEFLYLKRWVLKIREENKYNMPKIGMMLETKEALEHIEDFIDADFISIGTNDLTKELYSIKRDSVINNIDDYLSDLIDKLKKVIHFCNTKNICLSVCGELASIRKVASLFYDIGIKNLSVSPSSIRMLNLAYSDFEEKNNPLN